MNHSKAKKRKFLAKYKFRRWLWQPNKLFLEFHSTMKILLTFSNIRPKSNWVETTYLMPNMYTNSHYVIYKKSAFSQIAGEWAILAHYCEIFAIIDRISSWSNVHLKLQITYV